MRGSRIPHPPGGRHIKIWRWAVQAVGREAAAVLGEIEWRDRCKDEAGVPVATRAGLIGALEGFVSRNGVDAALRLLVELGWLKKHERTTPGERNLRTWHEFSLDAAAIALFLASPFGDAGDPGLDEIPASLAGDAGVPRSGTKAGAGAGTPSLCRQLLTPHGGGVVLVGQAEKHRGLLLGMAAAVGLNAGQSQMLGDALSGVLSLPPEDGRRPKSLPKWLPTVAKAIASGDFVAGDAYLSGRAARQALQAADPALAAAEAAGKRKQLAASADVVRREIRAA